MRTLGIALRILFDVAVYRLRKREAGNLVTAMTLALALRQSALSLGFRLLFGLALNLWVYLVNDCFDVGVDLRAPGRDKERTRFLAANMGVAWSVVAGLGLTLAVLGGLHSAGLLVAFVGTAAVIVAYSGWLKHRPVLDLLSMGAWGVTMGLVGFPLSSQVGWRFAGLLALLCMVTEAVQVLRDERSDRASDVHTTAVVLGSGLTVLLARGLIALSAVYACVMLHPWVGLGLLPALAVPLREKDIDRAWDALRVLFGLTWLALLAAYWLTGRVGLG